MTQCDSIKNVYAFLKKECQCSDVYERHSPLRHHLVVDESALNIDWWQKFSKIDTLDHSAFMQLELHVKQMEDADVVAIQALTERKHNMTRLKELQELHTQVTRLKTKRQTIEQDIEKAKAAINIFDEANKELIILVEKEQTIIVENLAIAEAYSNFVSLLNQFNEALPGKLIANLGESVVQLYNAFNRDDTPSNLLASLKFPVASGERIEISFRNAPDTYFDALHVLSEGHIRCIGLAILMAKNLDENCPILIFDDPVNSIDDDHRESIRKTLFEDDYLKDKQIILTCHGEEFFKDIQNLLGAERTKSSNRFTFLPQIGDKHIRIDNNSTPRNYVLAAQELIQKLETRNALKKARQALESLTKGKVWSYVSKHGDGNLSIKLRTANSPIELRNLAEQLKSKLSKPDFSHADKDAVLEPISTLLGINGDSREWRYLNKGTHEEADRAEFDRGVVTEIINCLASLDSAI